jgi:hypothetical protein
MVTVLNSFQYRDSSATKALSHKGYNIILLMPPTWKDGIVEQWNNGQNQIASLLGLWVLGSILTIFHGCFNGS